MTLARLAALAISMVLLAGAIWLVFVGIPKSPAPVPTTVAGVPTSGASFASPLVSGDPQPSAVPESPDASLGADPTPVSTPLDPLAKQVPGGSVDPDQLTGYVWPLRNALITSRFAPRPANLGGFMLIDGVSYHDGLDLATHCGDTILAAHDGTVLYAGRAYDPYIGYQGDAQGIYDRLERLGRANEQAIVIVIDDGNGYRSEYVHLSAADVEAGQVVSAGDEIGSEGMTGYATGCHLHYTMIRMDGPWQPVVARLLPYGYPPLVRERIDPLDVLPWGDQYAPHRLQDKVNPPSPTPEVPASPSPAAS